MSMIRNVAAVVGVAVAVARHPTVRAAVRAAPLLITPKMRVIATEATLDAAFRAGSLARKIARR
jgi:hypothetical protein